MRPLRPIFIASFFFTFHLALLSYLNSSVIALHNSPLQTTLTYTISSALSILLLVLAPRIVRRTGSSKFLIGTLVLSAMLLGLLGAFIEQSAFIPIFIAYFAMNTVIWYAFDLVVEHYSRERVTGNIRGLYLTLNNAGWVLAPIAASAVIVYSGFAGTYIVGGMGMLAALIFLSRTPIIREHRHVPQLSLTTAFRALVAHPKARRIVTLYFVLQFFFALMVIYMAPYLLSFGFSWSTIGIILSIMLLPFVIFQYGAGKYADRYHAEGRLIRYGFAIAAVATLLLAFPLPPLASIFAIILFLTRIGASIIEVGCESAFFKAVSEHDTALIGTLRMTLPLAYIIAPLIGAFILTIGNMHTLFVFLAWVMGLGVVYTYQLKFGE